MLILKPFHSACVRAILGADRYCLDRYGIWRWDPDYAESFLQNATLWTWHAQGETRGQGDAEKRNRERVAASPCLRVTASVYFISPRSTSTAFSIWRSWPERKSGGVLSTRTSGCTP